MVNFTPPPQQDNANPLQKYFRQPKVYITLPSKGQWYQPGSIVIPETQELPIYPMTAKDELTMKTPDALLNGQATVDLIQSCVPSIKDAWQLPSIDLDAILIAIRIATYGETLEITTKVPGTGEEKEYQVDLRQILNKLTSIQFENTLTVQGMQVEIRPLTYKEFTRSSLKTFEEQRLFRLVNDEKVPEEEKLSKFNESFQRLTSLTVDTMAQSIVGISFDETVVTNSEHILEFIQNSEKNWFRSVLDHLEKEKEKFQIEPMTVITSEEEQEAGAPKEFLVPITFDQSNFFA